MIISNPSRRCALCQGRELLDIDEDREIVLETNLIQLGDNFYCKDKDECAYNVEAEQTMIDMLADEDGIKGYKILDKNGNPVIEVYKNDKNR